MKSTTNLIDLSARISEDKSNGSVAIPAGPGMKMTLRDMFSQNWVLNDVAPVLWRQQERH